MSPQDGESARLRLMQQVLNLPAVQLAAVEDFFARLQASAPAALPRTNPAPAGRDWPHAPMHRLCERGTYMVTSGTYEKANYFRGSERLDYLETQLLSQAKAFGWQLDAWAVFSNHYHFVAHSPPDPKTLSAMTRKLHSETAEYVNLLDQLPGRKVWFNYWETHLTFEKSYFARLSYVHRNPVKHGLAATPAAYRWCSAAWLERTALPAMVQTLYRFKIDKIATHDDFDPI